MSWRDWSSWIKEGYFISYEVDGVRYYEHVLARDFAHWVYVWPEAVGPGEESGPTVPSELQVTVRYNPDTGLNRIWQVIFGIEGQVYVYVEHPTDIHRHGLPKLPKPTSTERKVSHFEEWMSPFHEPSFITEHFLLRPGYDRMALSIYNPQDVSVTPKLNFLIAKLVTERIGKEEAGVLTPRVERFRETLDKLARRVIPHRPLTLRPVRAPPTGR